MILELGENINIIDNKNNKIFLKKGTKIRITESNDYYYDDFLKLADKIKKIFRLKIGKIQRLSDKPIKKIQSSVVEGLIIPDDSFMVDLLNTRNDIIITIYFITSEIGNVRGKENDISSILISSYYDEYPELIYKNGKFVNNYEKVIENKIVKINREQKITESSIKDISDILEVYDYDKEMVFNLILNLLYYSKSNTSYYEKSVEDYMKKNNYKFMPNEYIEGELPFYSRKYSNFEDLKRLCKGLLDSIKEFKASIIFS